MYVCFYCFTVFWVACFFWVFFTFVAFFPSVLWYCWLGLLTCKTVSHITYTVLVETLNPARSLTHSALYLLSPLLDHLHDPYYKSPTAGSDMHYLACGISFLLHSVTVHLLSYWFILSCTYHFTTEPVLLAPSFTPSTFHSRLETHSFHKYFPLSRTSDLDRRPTCMYWALAFVCFSFFFWSSIFGYVCWS